MIEKVARAIYEATPRNKPYELLTKFMRDAYEAKARTAIEALREPTSAVLDAGFHKADQIGAISDNQDVAGILNAMLDEALKVQP